MECTIFCYSISRLITKYISVGFQFEKVYGIFRVSDSLIMETI